MPGRSAASSGWISPAPATAHYQRNASPRWVSRDCVPTHTLIADAQGLLHKLGFSGWRATAGPERIPGGPCGMFTATGATYSDPTASLDPRLTPSRSTAAHRAQSNAGAGLQ